MRRAASVVLGLSLLAIGCDDTTQSPFIVRVSDINNGSTLLADVIALDQQTQQYVVPTELVPVVISNRPYSSATVVDPEAWWYDFQVTRYSVSWSGGYTQFNHTEETTLLVPFDGEATLFALPVPISMKTTPPFVDLQSSSGSIDLVATIDFVGAPASDPSKEIHIPAALSVSFANFVDKEN